MYTGSTSPYAPHYALYPKSYTARRYISPKPLQIDGDLTKPAWSNISWSDAFSDITGDSSLDPPSTCETKFKMQWDDDYLYIAVLLQSYDRTVVTSYTERNSPIYQLDSDIEVFVDALGCCHNYKELELNGYNTVWNLMLDKPYDDGGSEHSGRIASPGEELYYEVTQQHTATKLLWGDWNDPKGAVWSVEIALAHSDTLASYSRSGAERALPRHGMRWRINLSRVEEKGAVNWTWSPQVIWEPEEKQFLGKVAMHLPDAWGYVDFVGEDKTEGDTVNDIHKDPAWPARLAAMNVYSAQKYHHRKNDCYADQLSVLAPFLDQDIVSPFDIQLQITKTKKHAKTGKELALHYTVTVKEKNGPIPLVVTVSDDRLVTVNNGESAAL